MSSTPPSTPPYTPPSTPRLARRPGLATLLVVALGVGLVLGCDAPGDSDSGGAITFSDAAGGCGAEPLGVSTPIAAGARLEVRVRRGDVPLTVQSATTLDSSVAAVEAVEAVDGNLVAIRAGSIGATELRVAGPAGEEGTVGLRVAALGSSVITPDPLTLPNLDAALETVHPGGSDALTAAGWGLLPDGWIELDVAWVGDDGGPLLGWDLAAWTSDPPGVIFERARDFTDEMRVSPGSATGTVTLSIHGGATFELMLAPAGSAASLTAWSPDTGLHGVPVTLVAGRVATLIAVLQDASGRVLRGHDGKPPTASSADPAVAELVEPPWSEGDDGVELTAELRELLEASAVFYLQARSPGTTVITLERAGLTHEVTVTVSQASGAAPTR